MTCCLRLRLVKSSVLRRDLSHVGSGPIGRWTSRCDSRAERQVQRRATRLASAIDDAGSLYVAERLHLVRIAAKKLRYAMEIERELKRSRITSRVRPLKALQEILGHLHDLHVLSEQVRGVQADLDGSDRRLESDLDGLVAAIEDDCRTEHAGYMRREVTSSSSARIPHSVKPRKRRSHNPTWRQQSSCIWFVTR